MSSIHKNLLECLSWDYGGIYKHCCNLILPSNSYCLPLNKTRYGGVRANSPSVGELTMEKRTRAKEAFQHRER